MISRIKFIRKLIEINEQLIFYPRIRSVYKILNKKNQFNLIFDIGTNKGQSINQFLRVNPKVLIYGFEPNTNHYNKLLGKKNLRIFNIGCSNVNSELTFHENILDESSTFEEVDIESKWLKKKADILGRSKNELIKSSYKVECVKLSSFIRKYSINEIDLIKIDVEGHEYKVLQGLFDQVVSFNVKFIQIESHNDDLYRNSNSDSIERLLARNGFYIYKSIKHGFGDIRDIIYKHEGLNA